MRLVEFTGSFDGRPLFVNPEYVAILQAGWKRISDGHNLDHTPKYKIVYIEDTTVVTLAIPQSDPQYESTTVDIHVLGSPAEVKAKLEGSAA